MKRSKRTIVLVVVVVVLLLALVSCRDTLGAIKDQLTGKSDAVQEEDTTRWADATADPLIIQGIADASAKFDTAMVDGTLYAVFNGIWSRQTN